MAIVKLADIIKPTSFTQYAQLETEKKSRLIQSNVLAPSQRYSELLAGGGDTWHEPSWNDLDSDDAENIGTDDETVVSTPSKITSLDEQQIRLSRNKSWSSMDLAAVLAGDDPLGAVAARVGNYRSLRLQAAVIATLNGIFADNAAAPTGSEHIQNDLSVDIKGASFQDGLTNISNSAIVDAKLTMGDSSEALGVMFCHSVVHATLKKKKLIETFVDPETNAQVRVVDGTIIIVDDSMPASGGVYESWFMGVGAMQFGAGNPRVPTEVWRAPAAGNGAGQEVLFNRWEWIIHPVGHRYAGTYPKGGPTNAATTNNLAHADSWQRVFAERKQIKIARLITREA